MEDLQAIVPTEQEVFIRMTPLDTITKEFILDEFKKKYPDSKLIVSQEDATRPHFHLLLVTKIPLGRGNQNLRNFIKTTFSIPEGNSGQCLQEVKKGTQKKVASYTVKEGLYSYYGFTDKEMKVFERCSYKKFEGKKFTDELEKIQEKYYADENAHINDFIQDYVILKTSYNQTINVNSMINYINLIYTKKNGPEKLTKMISQKFFKQEDFSLNHEKMVSVMMNEEEQFFHSLLKSGSVKPIDKKLEQNCWSFKNPK